MNKCIDCKCKALYIFKSEKYCKECLNGIIQALINSIENEIWEFEVKDIK